MTYHFWFVCFPDLSKPIGGVKQIHRCAEALIELGFQATLIQQNRDFHPSWFQSVIPTISKDDWENLDNLKPDIDILILPETFAPIFLSYCPNLRKIIFNQNGSYSFGLPSVTPSINPSGVLEKYTHPSIIQCWCVSEYDYRLLTFGFGIPVDKVFLLSNAMDVCSLPVPSRKKRQIAYMPRKNNIDSLIVKQLLQNKSWLQGWTFVAIENLTHEQVFEVLNETAIFLSFGHPEGFGLPVGEAMACGCAVVGFSGLGGRELFRIGNKYQMCVLVEFGDWTGFIDGVSHVVNQLTQEPLYFLSQMKLMSQEIKNTYSASQMKASLRSALSHLVNN